MRLRRLLPPVLLLALCAQSLLAATPTLLPGVHWVSIPVRSKSQEARGMNGGEGAQCLTGIARCATSDNRIYLGVDSAGIWRSDDGGAFWQPCLLKGFYAGMITAIAVCPTNRDRVLCYSATTWDVARAPEEGLYLSDDAGSHWRRVVAVKNADDTFQSRETISYARDGRTVYFGAYTHGVYRSEDGGSSWSGPLGLVGVTINKIVVDPFDTRKAWAATSSGIQVSTDAGVTWRVIAYPNVATTEVSPDPVTKNRIYIIKPGVGLMRSDDAGATWTFVPSGDTRLDTTADRLFQSPIDSRHMYLSSGRVDRVTSDAGATWHAVVEDLSGSFVPDSGWGDDAAMSYSYKNPDRMVGDLHCGIYASNDAGRTFHDSCTGYTGFDHGWDDCAMAFSSDPNRFATFNYDYGPAVTFDDGNTWFNKVFNGRICGWSGSYCGDMSPDWNQTHLIISTEGNYWKSQPMRSTTGTSAAPDWVSTYPVCENHYFLRFDHRDAQVVYMDDMRSDDAGKTWTKLAYAIRGMAPSNARIVYAYADGGVMKSVDRGEHWTRLPKPPARASGREIAVDPVDPDRVWCITGNDLSLFDGKRWTRFPASSWANPSSHPQVDRVAVDPTNRRRVIVGLDDMGDNSLFLTDDAGRTWHAIDANLPHMGIGQTLNIQPITGRIFVCCGFGTYAANIGVGYPRGGDRVAPSAPAHLACAAKTGTSVTLAWKASRDNVAVRAYDVYCGGDLAGTTPRTTYTVMSLLPGRTYRFRVVARDNAGNQTPSRTIQVTTPAMKVPRGG